MMFHAERKTVFMVAPGFIKFLVVFELRNPRISQSFTLRLLSTMHQVTIGAEVANHDIAILIKAGVGA